MNNIDNAVDVLISSVRESAVYSEYTEQLSKVKQFPELKKQIDEFRARNFELQNSAGLDVEKLELFEKEYETFREDPLVADFLGAELALCRVIQEINNRIVSAMNFD